MKSLRNCLSATEIAKCLSLLLPPSLSLSLALSRSLRRAYKKLWLPQGCRVDLLPAAIECQKLFRHNCCHFVNLPLSERETDIEWERARERDANESKQKRICWQRLRALISISKQTNGNARPSDAFYFILRLPTPPKLLLLLPPLSLLPLAVALQQWPPY